jgi:hypothetical protein
MKMEQIECSETSAYKIQTPGNHPEENIQHSFHFPTLLFIKNKELKESVFHVLTPHKQDSLDNISI